MPPKKKRRLNPVDDDEPLQQRSVDCVYCAPTVSNCVSTAEIKPDFDLRGIAACFGRQAEKTFPCCTINVLDPKATCQVTHTFLSVLTVLV